MSMASTQVSGTATIRPVLLGVVLDVTVADDVVDNFRALARAWGGCFSAVLPDSVPAEGIEERFHAFDLDALWLQDELNALSGPLRENNMLWSGSGDWGPFGVGRYKHGLLPWNALRDAPTDVAGDHDPLLEWFVAETSVSAAHLADLSAVPSACQTRSINYSPPVILLVDRRNSEHQIEAWNLRALATRLAVVDDDGSRQVEWGSVVDWCRAPRRDEPDEVREIWVSDLRGGSASEVTQDLADALNQAGVSWTLQPRDAPAMYPRVLRTDLNTSFNVTMPYGGMRATATVPSVPLGGDGSALGDYRTVAVEVHINALTGHDPRLVGRLPNHPRFSDLLRWVTDDAVRVARPTDWGFVAGLSAETSSINLQLHRKSEVFARLLGPKDVVVEQSDVGLFQTRAAEMLGGMSGAALTQPGLAAALRLLASHPAGVPLARLKAEIIDNRGLWPDALSRTTPSDYGEGVLRALVGSGMVRAVLKAKCTYCRASMQLDPDDMANTMVCDFCGQDVRFAPMVGWGSPKWVFRLAGHLTDAQVQAMIPALAALGQLSHLTALQGGIDCAELGLMVTSGGRTVEADIAAYLPTPIPVTILGEVKNRNRIDVNDISNLEWLQDKLEANGFDSLILFATTKDAFGPEETAALRRHCETRALALTVRRSTTPRLPLVLTGSDLFLPWMNDDHIGRWAREAPALAIHGTALESCRRNLGLETWSFQKDDEIHLSWKEMSQT